jgi:hypothetical protein
MQQSYRTKSNSIKKQQHNAFSLQQTVSVIHKLSTTTRFFNCISILNEKVMIERLRLHNSFYTVLIEK